MQIYFEDRIEFKTENLKLTEWSNRTLNSDTKYNYNIQYENKAALSLLENIFNKKTQGKYNATDNPPNLILILNNEDYYEILTGINVVDNQITLYLQPQSNTNMLPVTENTNLKIIIDGFPSSYYVRFGNEFNQKYYNAFPVIFNDNAFSPNTIDDAYVTVTVDRFNFMIIENANSRNPLFFDNLPLLKFTIGRSTIIRNLESENFLSTYIPDDNKIEAIIDNKTIDITENGINFRLLFRNNNKTMIIEKNSRSEKTWWNQLFLNIENQTDTYIYLGIDQNEKIIELKDLL